MRLSGRRYVGILASAIALPVAAVLGFNLIVDPLLLFGLDRSPPQVYYTRNAGYYSNVGIIRNHQFDLALFGESTSRDASATDLTATFGLPARKIAFTSGSYGLLTNVFEFVHAEVGLEVAIFDLIPENIHRRFTRYHPDWARVATLYDDNRANDLLFYLSTDTTKASVEKLFAKRNRPDNPCPRYGDFIYELDQINMHLRFNKCRDSLAMKGGDLAAHRDYWQDHWAPLDRWESERHLRIAIDLLAESRRPVDSKSNSRINRIRRNVARFRRFAKSHEDVSFVFYFPPRPAYRYAARMLDDPAEFTLMLRGIKALVEGLEPVPNVRIFGFGDRAFTLDWTNYLEGSHFRPEITRSIMRDMAAGRGRLTAANVDEYLEGFVSAIGETKIPAEIYQEAEASP